MLSNTQTVTISGTAHNLERTAMGNGSGTFKKVSAGLTLTVANSYGKRNSVIVKLTSDKTVPDPFIAGVNRPQSMSAHLVINTPPTGFTPAEIEGAAQGLVDALDVPGLLTKIVNGEA